MFVNKDYNNIDMCVDRLFAFDQKKGKEPIAFVNHLIVILLCIWIVWPYFNYKTGMLLGVTLIVLWLFTTDYRWFFKNWTLDIVLIWIWIIMFIPYIITGNFRYGAIDSKYALLTILLFIFGIFINQYYMFYKKDFIILGRIAFISLLMYLIGSIQTYYGLQEFKYASRMLATVNDPMQDIYLSLGIGGFGFIYSSVFIIILALYFLKIAETTIKEIYGFAIIIFTVVEILTIVKASYAIALIFTFIGMTLAILAKDKRGLVLLIFSGLILMIIIPEKAISEFIINTANFFEDNDVIYSKLTDLAQVFLGDSMGSQTIGRANLYLMSLNTFIHNPLFGIYGPFGNPYYGEIGGHSGWLDLMAMYGIFGSLPLFLGLGLNFRKQLLFYSNHRFNVILMIVQILFVCFGFINPIIYIYQIGFAIFVIAPALPFLPYAFKKKIDKI